jgi:ubiquinone/menaquinone biosynthesis C-methylase UbiE|tara:strand:+ start:1245 stop:2009 length:765 start_codon:yes stop_codon:yes gene_type:complete
MTQLENTDYITLKRSVYREYSRSYNEDRDRFVSGTALAERIDWALGPLRPGKNLLDLGCGSGRLLRQAVERTGGKSVLAGLDLTPGMLALARYELGTNVTLVEGNAAVGLPFKDESFDVVTSLNLVHELPADAVPALFEDVYRLLRKGGTFRAVVPCMAENNQAAEMFRQMSQVRGAMDFRYADDLRESLLAMPNFVERGAEFRPSTAAANAAKGSVRFTLFADILNDIKSLGLDPGQVQQGVIFFSGNREPGN